jgi:molybdate transport system regulatory protein
MGRVTARKASKAAAKTSLHLRIDFGGERSIGPGKVQLLELINETGSISAAGRALAMSYRQAWLLIDELNHMFREPAVIAQTGGGGGGGAIVTETGNDIVRLYRQMERRAYSASTTEMRTMSRLLSPPAAAAKPARVTA